VAKKSYPYEFSEKVEEKLKPHMMFGGPWRGPLMTHGKGVYCYDRQDKAYLDCESQAWSLCLGFGNQEVMDAAFEQAQNMYHMKGGLNTFPRLRLVEKILSMVPDSFDRVAFEPSGSLSVEAAFKIALINNPDARYIVSLYDGFHGSSFATMAAGWASTKSPGKYGGGRKYLGFMENFVKAPNPYCYRCPYGKKHGSCGLLCAEQLRNTILHGVPGPTAAVILEPVQGSGGQIPCPADYLKRVREICDELGVILIFDEMQTGFGRTGKFFAMEYYGVTPDIFTMGKSMANGFPIAGVCVNKKLKGFQDGADDNFTFVNNTMAQTASLKTIEILQRDHIPDNVAKMGKFLTKGLKELQKKYPIIGDVRGPGLLIGFEMVKDPVTKEPDIEMAGKIYSQCIENGLILGLGGAHPNVVKVKPPLIITQAQCEELLEKLELTFKQLVG